MTSQETSEFHPYSVIEGVEVHDKASFMIFAELSEVLAKTFIKHVKDKSSTYNSAVASFRAVENEYIERFQGHEENRVQVRRNVMEFLLEVAWYKDEPFETCQLHWHELQKLGFSSIEREEGQVGVFGAICLAYGQIDVGLAAIDPFVAKIQTLRVEPNAAEAALEYYDAQIDSFAKLRARLEAARSEQNGESSNNA
jgi:hypothetical protein